MPGAERKVGTGEDSKRQSVNKEGTGRKMS